MDRHIKKFRNVFNEKYIPEPNSGCFLWTGYYCKDGYGRIYDRRAHRLAYKVFVGEIPRGMCICHKCDVPCCVNPDHLFIGTNSDNSADMSKKGRHGNTKLTAKQVSEIRSLKGKEVQEKTALRYQVHPSAISGIQSGRTRRHTP
jgi:hypothetical protein